MPTAPQLEFSKNAQQWDDLIRKGGGHLLQTWSWGDIKSRFGWRAERSLLASNEDAPTAAQILYRRIAPGMTIGYVPRGPVMPDSPHASEFLQQLSAHVRWRGAFLLKLEPDWLQGDPRDQRLAKNKSQVNQGFVRSAESVQPAATIQIDLTPSTEAILARFKPKWRYNVRLAEKKGVTVRSGALPDLNRFYELMQITGQRDHFAIHSLEYYTTAFEHLSASNRVCLLVAEFESRPLAMIFVTANGDEAIYLYGASSNEERNRMPNHALHWAAMKWAKERGCLRYDLWGIPEQALELNGDSSLPDSLYQFKQGFGGHAVRYTGAWDLVLDPVMYKLYRLARRVRAHRLA